jgi:H+/Cl- antiporter ClcA
MITDYRAYHAVQLIPFLSIAGVLIVFIYSKLGKNSNKGMSLIFDAGFDENIIIPKRLVPLVMLSTWITHLFGGSAGREGVAVQIGATISHTIGRKIYNKGSLRVFLVTGMAAGFSGLFQTPLAGVLFAMEVLSVGSFEIVALFPSIIAAFVASYTSHVLGLEKFRISLDTIPVNSAPLIMKLILLGIIFGIVGGVFAHCLHYCKERFHKLVKNPLLLIFGMGCIISILLLIFYQGRYSGLGTNIINACFTGEKIYNYDWILKMLFTILTLAVGFQGGEVTPLFAIGSSLGAVLATVLGLPMEFTAALGYAAIFGSATNTMLAPIFIGVEVFGYEYLPYFFVVCALAYVFNGNRSIYAAQRK